MNRACQGVLQQPRSEKRKGGSALFKVSPSSLRDAGVCRERRAIEVFRYSSVSSRPRRGKPVARGGPTGWASKNDAWIRNATGFAWPCSFNPISDDWWAIRARGILLPWRGSKPVRTPKPMAPLTTSAAPRPVARASSPVSRCGAGRNRWPWRWWRTAPWCRRSPGPASGRHAGRRARPLQARRRRQRCRRQDNGEKIINII